MTLFFDRTDAVDTLLKRYPEKSDSTTTAHDNQIPYARIRCAYVKLLRDSSEAGEHQCSSTRLIGDCSQDLRKILQGSTARMFKLQPAPARSKELEERLVPLRKASDEREYNRLVSTVRNEKELEQLAGNSVTSHMLHKI
jgi:hypothetical protein